MAKPSIRDIVEIGIVGRVKSHLRGKPTEVQACISLLVGDNWEQMIPAKVEKAIDSLQVGFHRSKNDDKSTPLTATAIRIGRAVLSRPRERSIKELLLVGDLFIEAFYNTKVILLHQPGGYKAPHLVSPGGKWEEMTSRIGDNDVGFRGIRFEKPADTTSNFREWLDHKEDQDNPIVQTVVKRKQSSFEIDLESPWVKALDKQQQTPLRVNRDVLEAIDSNRELFVKDKRDVEEDEIQSNMSKTTAHDFTLRKANKVAEYDKFYSMMDADYRGRLYHIEGYFNYQGSDVARALIEFYNGKHLTASGHFWLEVHTASVANQSYKIGDDFSWTGYDYNKHLEEQRLDTISVDKMALEHRAIWTQKNIGRIVELGHNRQFDMSAEKPAMFLAACIEWANYAEAEAAGVEYLSRIPIAIDGSNNGWQHLAAMSRDRHAGKLVGMTNEDVPNDFYLTTGKHLVENMTDERLSSILSKMSMKDIRKGISKRGSINKISAR